MRDKDKLFELYKIFLPIYYNKYVTETRNGYKEAIKDALQNAEYAYDTFHIKNTISETSVVPKDYLINQVRTERNQGRNI